MSTSAGRTCDGHDSALARANESNGYEHGVSRQSDQRSLAELKDRVTFPGMRGAFYSVSS